MFSHISLNILLEVLCTPEFNSLLPKLFCSSHVVIRPLKVDEKQLINCLIFVMCTLSVVGKLDPLTFFAKLVSTKKQLDNDSQCVYVSINISINHLYIALRPSHFIIRKRLYQIGPDQQKFVFNVFFDHF